jgi:hypothetical protein
MPRRYQAQPDRNRSQTWRVVDTQTGRVILRDYPGYYAKEVARDCNADPQCGWLRKA